MRRKKTMKNVSSSDSSDDEPLSAKVPKAKSPKTKKTANDADSSSESDIENYLQPADKIDLNSPFFNISNDNNKPSTSTNNKTNRRLTDSDFDSNDEEPLANTKQIQETPAASTFQFKDLQNYSKKLEEMKRCAEEYKMKKQTEDQQMNINKLLAAGEAKQTKEEILAEFDISLNSSDYETCSESEKEGWEEVNEKQKEEKKENGVSKEGLQITVEMPGRIKKKKGVDLMASIKRRINRIKKETQVSIHKVHVLSWIAHGNFVSSTISSPNLLALSLSLIPPAQCRPAKNVDLNYLEEVLKWYRNDMNMVEAPVPQDQTLHDLIERQLVKRKAYNKSMLVYIFVVILRSLGIQCRLVLSFQVEPLRPPDSELISLSTKNDTSKAGPSKKKAKNDDKSSAEESENDENQLTDQKNNKRARSKSASETLKVVEEENKKTRSKSTSTTKSTDNKKSKVEKESSKLDVEEVMKTRSKSTSESNKVNSKKSKKIGSSNIADTAKPPVKKNKTENPKVTSAKLVPTSSRTLRSKVKAIPQVDGANDSSSDEEMILQVDGANDNEASSKASPRSTRQSKCLNMKMVKNRNTNFKDNELTHLSKKNEKSKAGPNKRKAKNDEKSNSQENGSVKNHFTVQKNYQKDRSKSTSETLKVAEKENKKTRSKSTSTAKSNDNKKTKSKKENDSSKLEEGEHLNMKMVKNEDIDSEDDFTTRSPFSNKNSPQVNGSMNMKKINNKPQRTSKSSVAEKTTVEDVKKPVKEQKQSPKKRRSGHDSEADSDYVPEVSKKKRRESEDDFIPKTKSTRRAQAKKTGADENKIKKKAGTDIWAEVFVESEKKWISVDVVKGQVNCVKELCTRASQPVCYIVAWNNQSQLKDVTGRYCQNFNTVTRKLRVDSKWWEETLKPFLVPKTPRDKAEDEELEKQQLEKPLPTTISEYKNHPLYALKRHLLKFEAIYPPDAPTLGFVRNEPVYSRQCVYTLHSRDIWLKKAKVVKLGEQPYKIVKARPKYDKLSNSLITDQLLEIFGPWQVEDYVPPTAENGVVPRNAFGNVDLFLPSMLPKKCVHLKLPGLNKLARRMNIDCASAIVGFDFHGGWSHPTYDGYVVCEEFAEILTAAWELEQDELDKREQEKLDKRVYGNWKRLIRGLLIRERLKAKYEFGEVPEAKGNKKAKGAPKLAIKKKKLVIKKKKAENSESESE